MDYRVSFAQNREDLIIAGFFPDVDSGHYVDVGAGHPRNLSVTKLFYDAGWSGINIEPIPELAAQLIEERPRDITLQLALSSEPGTAPFRQYVGSGLSTFNRDIITANEENPSAVTSDHTDYEVTLSTLAAVLDEHPLPHIHFLKIDVEGSEYDVLSGSDWERIRPELLCIETDHMTRDWRPLLASARYTEVFHDGLNAYFVAEEAHDRAEAFRFSDAVLGGPVLVTPAVANQLDLVGDLGGETQQLTQQNEKLRHETQRLTRRNEKLTQQREQLSSHNTQLAQQLEGVLRQAKDLSGKVQQLADDIEVRDAALVAERSISALYATREAETAARLHATEAFLAEVLGSQSWRYTYPVRRFSEILKARLPRRLLRRVWHRVRPAVEAARTPAIIGEGDLSLDGAAVLERLEARGPS